MTINPIPRLLLTIARALPLLARRDDISFSDAICDYICDEIASDRFSLRFSNLLLSFARLSDRTESRHAAHIRDTIRDTF